MAQHSTAQHNTAQHSATLNTRLQWIFSSLFFLIGPCTVSRCLFCHALIALCFTLSRRGLHDFVHVPTLSGSARTELSSNFCPDSKDGMVLSVHAASLGLYISRGHS